MYGKYFDSTFTGSMMGAGPTVFAVWGYVIAHAVEGQVELNPKLLAVIIGTTEEDINTAISYLESPDVNSRTPDEEGRRMIREGQFAYRVVNHSKYKELKSEDQRRDYMRDYMRKRRSKDAVSQTVNLPLAGLAHTEADTEAEANTDTDTEAETFWFESVWKEYPRKVEKSSARKKFYSVVKSRSLCSQMLSAVRNYATEVKLNGTEQKYIKHAATFFNGPWRDYMDGVWAPPVQKGRLPPPKAYTEE